MNEPIKWACSNCMHWDPIHITSKGSKVECSKCNLISDNEKAPYVLPFNGHMITPANFWCSFWEEREEPEPKLPTLQKVMPALQNCADGTGEVTSLQAKTLILAIGAYEQGLTKIGNGEVSYSESISLANEILRYANPKDNS